MVLIACDRNGCDTEQAKVPNNNLNILPPGWVYIINGARAFIYCSEVCLVTEISQKHWRTGQGKMKVLTTEES